MSLPPPLSAASNTSPLSKPSTHRRTLSSFAEPSRNSSLNTRELWAEDYCDYSEDAQGLGITPPPAAATTTRPFPKSVPLEEGEDSWPARQPRTHQRSLTELLPFSKSRSRETSPKKLVRQRTDINELPMALTGDKDDTKVADRNKGGLVSWFSGSSATVNVGVGVTIPSGEMEEPSKMPCTSPVKTSTSSRFNFFSSPKAPTTIQLPQKLLESDDLLTLDIKSVLYPSGEETFSPAAFKNLQQNAEGLLLKLQTAYKLLVLEHHKLSSENVALDDEVDEAETRAECLKTQLDDMASRASEKDRVIEYMVTELAHEKQMRAQEKEAREKSIALVREQRKSVPVELQINTESWRSDCESDGDSVFSRPPSMASAGSSGSSVMESPEILQASFGRVVELKDELGGVQRPKLVQQASTFQKMMNAATGVTEEKGCLNCRGKDASVAWDTVGVLRAENVELKFKVGVLGDAVDAALGDIAGFGL